MTGSLAAFAWNPLLKDISAVAFKDAAGGDVSLADFRGKVLLVNLWATWCGPCRREMPHLNALQQELGGDDFQIIALSLDRAGPEAAQVFLDETGAEALTLYIDQTSDTGRKLGVFGLPATLLVDRQGRELGRLLGPADWHGAEAKALINWAVGLK